MNNILSKDGSRIRRYESLKKKDWITEISKGLPAANGNVEELHSLIRRNVINK